MSKILLVDDDSDVLFIVEIILAGAGFEVSTTSSPAEAVKMAVDGGCDAVVLDVNMPEQSGYVTLEELRSNPRTAHLPVLFLSAQASVADRIRGLRQGADDYLTKPCQPEELVLRVERLVARSAPPGPAPVSSARDEMAVASWPDLQQALDADQLLGLTLGRYEVEELLGRGAMGVVLRGWDPLLKRSVALKTLVAERLSTHSVDELVAELLLEAGALARLNDPHVVTVHDVGKQGDIVYLVMEFVAGKSLATCLAQHRRLSAEAVTALGLAVARGLEAAHQAGIVHRDVKPDNILLGADDSIKVTDFGVATVVSRSEAVCGTPGFMPPELLYGREHREPGDLFSLGAVLYLCLTGEPAFAGNNTHHTLVNTLRMEPVAPQDLDRDVPEKLGDLVMELLAKKPEQRPPNAAALTSRLREIFPREPRWSRDWLTETETAGVEEEVFTTHVLERTKLVGLADLRLDAVG